jgi:hypothetical protein
VTELPIIVETSVWLSLTFGIILILASLLVARGIISTLQSEANPSVPRIAGLGSLALVAFGLGACVAVQKVGWQFRIDDTGFALRAPLDFYRPGGKIAWSEIESVSVIVGGTKGPAFHLRIVAKDGREITVTNVDRLPRQLGPVLQRLIAERAPQTKHAEDIAAQLDDARRSMGINIAAGYWVRNGRGELLR